MPNSATTRTQIDPELANAILEATKHKGLDDAFARRLIAWLSELSRGETNLEKLSEIREHFENLSATVDENGVDDEA